MAKMKKLPHFFLLPFSFFLLLAGCRGSVEKPEITVLSDLNRPECQIAVLAGSQSEVCADDMFEFAKRVQFDDLSIAVTALLGSRVDAVVGDEHALRVLSRRHPDRIRFLDDALNEQPAVVHFSPASSNLLPRMNTFIHNLKRSGVYDEMLSRWCYDDEDGEMPPALVAHTSPPTPRSSPLKVGMSGLREPLSFIDQSGNPTGFEVEFARRFADYLRVDVQIYLMPVESLRQSLDSGVIDMVVDGWYADGDAYESVGYLDCDVRAAVLRNDGVARDRALARFADEITDGVINCFVTDAHWQLLLYGLWITLLMTLCAAAIGFALAVGICAMRMSRRTFLRRIAICYITALQGIPVLIVLLVLSYVVFAGTGVDGSVTAIITLSLWFSANAAEMLRAGIRAVPRGQYDAAIALGFSPVRAFFGLILPQAMRVALPLLSGGVVNLLQQSSIVGYIAVMDLTMAIDLICGRSAEALVPLLATGVTYFIVAHVTVRIFALLAHRLDPAWRRRKYRKRRNRI